MILFNYSLLLLILLNITVSKNIDEDYDDDNDDYEELEDCQHEIDFKVLKKQLNYNLCETLEKPSIKSRIQLKIFVNHTEEKVHIRVLSSEFELNKSNENKSLIELTTDIIEDLKYPTSLLSIDNYQLISYSTLKSILLSLINIDLNLLSRNLKKTLLIEKGQNKQLLSCYGNYYPKQDMNVLNIKSTFTKPIICTKEPQNDKFFTLQEKFYLKKSDEKNFRLAQMHQDDSKKISRTTWFTCSNTKSCSVGIQNKSMLDKTVNYVVKFLEKNRTEKKKT